MCQLFSVKLCQVRFFVYKSINGIYILVRALMLNSIAHSSQYLCQFVFRLSDLAMLENETNANLPTQSLDIELCYVFQKLELKLGTIMKRKNIWFYHKY